MKYLRRISLMIAAISMILVVGGCSNTSSDKEDVEKNVFSLIYDSTKEVDKIIYTIGDFEDDITPMHEDKKVKKDYSAHVVMTDIETSLSMKIIDNGEVIYEKTVEKIDLTEEKNVDVKIVTNKDGEFDLEIKENK